jgi:hypothetical protein
MFTGTNAHLHSRIVMECTLFKCQAIYGPGGVVACNVAPLSVSSTNFTSCTTTSGCFAILIGTAGSLSASNLQVSGGGGTAGLEISSGIYNAVSSSSFIATAPSDAVVALRDRVELSLSQCLFWDNQGQKDLSLAASSVLFVSGSLFGSEVPIGVTDLGSNSWGITSISLTTIDVNRDPVCATAGVTVSPFGISLGS